MKMTPKAINVEAIENFELKVTFDNGETKIFDVKPYFEHELLKPNPEEILYLKNEKVKKLEKK